MALPRAFLAVSLFLLSSLLYSVLCCDCGLDAFQQTRPQAIRENWKYAKDVYTATVDEMYCKCFPTKGLSTKLRCVHVKRHGNGQNDDNTVLVASNKNEVTCDPSLPNTGQRSFKMMFYQDCDYVLTTAKATSTSVTMAESVPTIMDNSNKVDCGITTNMEEATRGKECDLTQQPCFYKMTIKKVYKGNQKEGVVIDAAGPDALTSCGSPKVQLTIGQTYMIGLGSICSLIQDWIPADKFTKEDISVIEELQKTSPNVDLGDDGDEEEKTGDEIDNWAKDDEYNNKEKELKDDEDDDDDDMNGDKDEEEGNKSEEEEELKKDGWAEISRNNWSPQDEEENDNMIDSLNRDLNM